MTHHQLPVYNHVHAERHERDDVTFVNEPPASFLRKLRKRPGKDIWLMGGGELARAFLQEDLVDRLYLGIVPVLPGEGIPLFPSGFPQREFTLLENKTCSKGLIALTYERSRSDPTRKSRLTPRLTQPPANRCRSEEVPTCPCENPVPSGILRDCCYS